MFHFGEYTVEDAKRYLAERGVVVRPPTLTAAAAHG